MEMKMTNQAIGQENYGEFTIQPRVYLDSKERAPANGWIDAIENRPRGLRRWTHGERQQRFLNTRAIDLSSAVRSSIGDELRFWGYRHSWKTKKPEFQSPASDKRANK